MKLKVSVAVLSLGIFIGGCSNQQSFGKLDKSPYATKECIQTMSRGAEIDHSTKIDKIVVYKKKRTLYTYRNGKQVNVFKFSLGKNGDKGNKVKVGDNPGGYITIHGQPKWNADGRGDNYTLAHDWTEGCLAVPNLAMDKLWKAVQNGVKIEIHS